MAQLLKQVPPGEKAMNFVSKMAGDKWKALPADAQATYKQRAAELKELYNDRLKVFKAECSTALKTSNSWKSARCYGE